jgi:hypothetical protein
MILLLFCLVCYYPTAPLMLHQILKIARHLNAFENDTLLRQVVVHMKDKYFKYWRDIPILYAFAFILDPRAKMRGFHKALPRLSTFTGTDYSRLPQDVRKGLTKLYQIYDTKFGDVRLRVHESSSTTEGKNKTVNQFDDSFSILGWWHGHKLTYPVLSILAKDVMTVPASIISSESTFSLVGRVIEERRRRLTPDMVEVLSCIKDRELADLHMQHNLEKDTLEIEPVLESLNNDGGQQGSHSRAQE